MVSERAEWRSPQVTLGIFTAYGGSARLVRWVGKGLAMRLAMGFPLTGRRGQSHWTSSVVGGQRRSGESDNEGSQTSLSSAPARSTYD